MLREAFDGQAKRRDLSKIELTLEQLIKKESGIFGFKQESIQLKRSLSTYRKLIEFTKLL